MNKDAQYAKAHKMQAAYKLAEIKALEARYAAEIARLTMLHEAAFGATSSAYSAQLVADTAETKADKLEREAQSLYEDWAAYAEANSL